METTKYSSLGPICFYKNETWFLKRFLMLSIDIGIALVLGILPGFPVEVCNGSSTFMLY